MYSGITAAYQKLLLEDEKIMKTLKIVMKTLNSHIPISGYRF